ncbi:MAG: DUF1573 domain-containing protein, partial [Deltaproteobacteria bacterium]|nr:DUF1573 domain-containing protein [Deltaproteobacteria bacterium]
GNVANAASGSGGLYLNSDSYTQVVTVANSLIVNNLATNSGGGLAGGVWLNVSGGGTSRVDNCTIVGNVASPSGGGGMGGGIFTVGGCLQNSIVWGNTADWGADISDQGGTFYNSCASDGLTDGADGCTTNNPMFTDASASDYTLLAGSPCIDTGDNALAPTNISPYDLAGNPRIQDGTVDMGAYEFAAVPPPDVVYVDASVGSSGAGTNWLTAFKTIQEGVEAVSTTGTVWVTNGVYNSGGAMTPGYALTNRVCITKAITVRSMNGPEVTIIAGAGPIGSAAVRGVFMSGGAQLIGFAITNGYTANSGDAVYDQSGAGILLATNCVVSNVVVQGNTANNNGGGAYLYYGGTLNNCTLNDNTANNWGGGAYFYQGGTLNDCTLNGNSADYAGGAYVYHGGTLNYCTLRGNSSSAGAGGACLDTSGTMNNCLVISNTAATYAGGVEIDYVGDETLNNCTIVGNTVTSGSGGMYLYQSGTLNNCIVYGNTGTTATDIYTDGGGSTIRNTCASDGITSGVDGCITEDPQLNADYTLSANSPCFNTGNNTYAPAGTDLAGNPRIAWTTVDMGSYELQALISPSSGPLTAGNTITVTNGFDFGIITNVLVGAPSVGSAIPTASGPNWFTITLPAATNAIGGTASLTVQTSDNGDTTLANAYTYNPQGEIIGSPVTEAFVIGAGSMTNITTHGCPISLVYESGHYQYLYLSNDFANVGLTGPTRILALGLDVVSPPSTYALPGYILRMKHTDVTNMLGEMQGTDLSLCYSNAAYSPTAGGFDMLEFDTPFEWNGSSNVIIDWAFAPSPNYCQCGQITYDLTAYRGWKYLSDDYDTRYIYYVEEEGYNEDYSASSDLPRIRILAEVSGEAITPSSGSSAGGYQVTISGVNLGDGTDITNVTLCGIDATTIVSQSSTQVVVVAGSSSGALVGAVRVYSTSYGETVKADAFSYYGISLSSGPYAGGNTITVTNSAAFGTITNVLIGAPSVGSAIPTASGPNWFTITLPAATNTTGGTVTLTVQTSDNGETILANAYTYNPAGLIGRPGSITGWVEVVGLPYQQSSPGVGVLNDQLYVAGGRSSITILTNVTRFDGSAWTEVAGLPQPRVDCRAAELNGNLYVMGGSYSSTKRTNVYGYSGGVWSEAAGLPSARAGFGLAQWRNALYAVGGEGSGGDATNVYLFDGSGRAETNGLPTARSFNTVAVLDDQLYSIGGLNGGTTRTNVYRYDGTNWTEVAGLPQPRCSMVTYAVGGFIYAIAGWTGSSASYNTFRYDGETWTEVISLPQARSSAGCGALGTDMYVVGGDTGGTVHTNVWKGSGGYSGGVLPTSGRIGDVVTIYGIHLGNGSDITNVTLCGVSAAIQPGQSATQVVVVVGTSSSGSLGDVVVQSTSFGATTKSNAFTYNAAGIDVTAPAFAPTPLGTIVTNIFTVTNSGNEALLITAATNNGAGAAYFDVTDLAGLTVAPGTASNIPVVFTASAIGTFTPTCYLVNNSPMPSYTFALTGSCFAASTNIGPYAGGNTITITNGYFGNITNVLVGPPSVGSAIPTASGPN